MPLGNPEGDGVGKPFQSEERLYRKFAYLMRQQVGAKTHPAFPEGNTPSAQDSVWRSLQKIVASLQ